MILYNKLWCGAKTFSGIPTSQGREAHISPLKHIVFGNAKRGSEKQVDNVPVVNPKIIQISPVMYFEWLDGFLATMSHDNFMKALSEGGVVGGRLQGSFVVVVEPMRGESTLVSVTDPQLANAMKGSGPDDLEGDSIEESLVKIGDRVAFNNKCCVYLGKYTSVSTGNSSCAHLGLLHYFVPIEHAMCTSEQAPVVKAYNAFPQITKLVRGTDISAQDGFMLSFLVPNPDGVLPYKDEFRLVEDEFAVTLTMAQLRRGGSFFPSKLDDANSWSVDNTRRISSITEGLSIRTVLIRTGGLERPVTY